MLQVRQFRGSTVGELEASWPHATEHLGYIGIDACEYVTEETKEKMNTWQEVTMFKVERAVT